MKTAIIRDATNTPFEVEVLIEREDFSSVFVGDKLTLVRTDQIEYPQ